MSSLSPGMKLSAYLLGRRIAGQRKKQDRVPVAYLYNGVRLPGLPGWAKDKRYICLYQYPENGSFPNYCWVYGFNEKPETFEEEMLFYTAVNHGIPTECTYRRAGMYPDGENWGTVGESDESGTAYMELSTVRWANYDVLNTDGTLYLAASAPIPIYE